MLVFLLLTGLSSLPPLFMHSGVQSFNALRQIFSVLNGFLLFFSGGLGLFIISSHLRSRSLKMVFTKPCSPALWLISAFLSAVFAFPLPPRHRLLGGGPVFAGVCLGSRRRPLLVFFFRVLVSG